ncbi:MAG: NRDE family protein [Flavobacteriaceae bacterium]|nr:NRDE family protein [Flavobacteriaceae bacterium]
MCTVSFVPLENGGYVFTSNRDESPLRKTLAPKQLMTARQTSIWAPVDASAGGSWIATDKYNRIVCLLNGGFEKHMRVLPYRKSRGKVVIEAFDAPDFSAYIQELDLEGIEPFTLILVDTHLQELVWDGVKKYIRVLSMHVPHLWSSATLYTREEHKIKKNYFLQQLEQGQSIDNVFSIHGGLTETPFILEKTVVRTVSITQLVRKNKQISLQYVTR